MMCVYCQTSMELAYDYQFVCPFCAAEYSPFEEATSVEVWVEGWNT
jgi:hypothetical protein